jgi:hypothetical protein
MLLAQSVDAIPADTLKWTLAILIVLLGVAALIIGIIRSGEKKRVAIDEQPVEVRKSPKRFNHELSEQRHIEVHRRLNEHDREIGSLWNAVRVDIPAMERRLNDAGEERSGAIHDRINEILSAVSELRGEVRAKK